MQRIKREMSQLDLWLKSGVPQWRISLIERGVPPRNGEAEKLAQALGTTPQNLFGRTNRENGISGKRKDNESNPDANHIT